MLLTTGRWAGVAVLIAVFARRRVAAEWPVMRHHLWYLGAMGAVGFTAFNALYYIAAETTVEINLGIIQGAIPDRQRVVSGKRVAGGVERGGRRLIEKRIVHQDIQRKNIT